MTDLVRALKSLNFQPCALYLIDATFCQDPTKFLSAAMTALSTMVMLECAHLNVLTKCDLLGEWQRSNAFDKYVQSVSFTPSSLFFFKKKLLH
jgi:hypothetical protein